MMYELKTCKADETPSEAIIKMNITIILLYYDNILSGRQNMP